MNVNIFSRFRAALIDMDGVLYDSMPGHTLAWKRMMNDLGVECTREEFYLYEGMTGVATIDMLFRREFGHGCEPERALELYEIKSKYFKQQGPAHPMPGADRMLNALRDGGLKRVLVTGSAQKNLLEGLNRDYPGIFLDDMRVTALDVKRGKPDPEPYLMGAAKADVKPSEAIVIENAPLGVRAGKAAGCFTIAVTTGPIPRSEFEREGADMIFDSMNEFADFLQNQLLAFQIQRQLDLLNPPADNVFVLLDRNVQKLHTPDFSFARSVMLVEGEEQSKSVETLCKVWQWLVDEEATRRSVLINVGGGVVSDLGGFAAASFKRGIRYINVPTTILAASDAAIGGKTGIDFMGLKNEIGAFSMPAAVVQCPFFFSTLPGEEIVSGIAEVIKMALITDEHLYERLLCGDLMHDSNLLREGVLHAARCKQQIVDLDPTEKGLRRILNFGHTAGHAFESHAMSIGQPISHGIAVAHGILFALMLSSQLCGLPADVVTNYKGKVLDRYFPPLPFGVEAAQDLIEIMRHDKKRGGDRLSFVLLKSIGNPLESVEIDKKTVETIIRNTIS